MKHEFFFNQSQFVDDVSQVYGIFDAGVHVISIYFLI